MTARPKNITRKGAGRHAVSDKKDWGTPRRYVDAVKQVFNGTIDLDPCSNRHSVVNALTEYRLPQVDGLKASWNFNTIFVNPPYGNDKEAGTTIKNWLAKCAHAHEDHESEILALVPVAVNTAHWKQHVFTKARAICFLYDTRLRFLENGEEAGLGAPMACAMIYWGQNYNRFFDTFIEFGAVVEISHLNGQKIGRSRKSKVEPLIDYKRIA